jgi:Utp21 specific WD40 associated putative domain
MRERVLLFSPSCYIPIGPSVRWLRALPSCSLPFVPCLNYNYFFRNHPFPPPSPTHTRSHTLLDTSTLRKDFLTCNRQRFKEWGLKHLGLTQCVPQVLPVEEGEEAEGEEAEEVKDIGRLLDYFAAEVAEGRNFELVQAVLAVALKVHADTIMAHDSLRQRAADVERQLSSMWRQMDDLLQDVRSMVDFFSNLQT